MTTSLDLLKQTGTVVVSDSGDFECEYAVLDDKDDYLSVFFGVLMCDLSDRCVQAPGRNDQPQVCLLPTLCTTTPMAWLTNVV